LRRFFALSAAIALNIRLRVCLTVATPFDRMACKVKSWLPHIKLIQNFLQSLEPPFVVRLLLHLSCAYMRAVCFTLGYFFPKFLDAL